MTNDASRHFERWEPKWSISQPEKRLDIKSHQKLHIKYTFRHLELMYIYMFKGVNLYNHFQGQFGKIQQC